ncbi:MAG: M28 family peptidase [Thermoplasmata archaeon]|nr:M28 family peptidase [Thermoplasmata archaeon]
MKIIISAHIDTVFKDPYCIYRGGILEGANDNFASIMALGTVLLNPIWLQDNIEIQLTEDEEMYMDGAKSIAKKNNPKDTFIIVMEVTEAKPGKNHLFTIENVHEIKISEIKKALPKHPFRIVNGGTESEAWLYAEHKFSVLEVCVPVVGGVHNLQSKTNIKSIEAVGKAIVALVEYFSTKDIASIRSEDD